MNKISQWNYENPDAAIPGHFGINGWDVTTGFLLFTKKFYGGAAFHYIDKQHYYAKSYAKLLTKIDVHSGANFTTGNFAISPNVLFSSQGDYRFLQLDLKAKFKILTWGGGIATNYLFTEIGLQNRLFKLCYTYAKPFVITDSNPDFIATHELHFNWFFKHKNKKQLSLRMI